MKFYAFVPTQTLIRSVLHFYPSSETVVAPYPVTCKLSFFHDRQIVRTMALDGLRLSQPDGVLLEDLLSGLGPEALGPLLGIEIDLDTKGRNTNLIESDCIVEIESQDKSIQYRALPASRFGSEGSEENGHRQVPLFNNQRSESDRTSLVLVNPTDRECEVSYSKIGKLRSEESEPAQEVMKLHIAPYGVVEQDIQALYDSCEESDQELDSADVSSLDVSSQSFSNDLLGFIMYRDNKTHTPLSVTPL